MDHGHNRWGKVTSNSTETNNGVFGYARELLIVYLIEHLFRYQREKYHERYLKACKWHDEGKWVTEYAKKEQVQLADEASRRTVEILERNHPFYSAWVQTKVSSVMGFVEVSINLDTHCAECPCNYFDEMGFSCVHMKAVLLALNKTTSWCNRRYLLSTYKECYCATIPSMVVTGRLAVDETFAPSDFRRPAGRPRKNCKDRSKYRKTDTQRECKVCGLKGHYASKCKKPNTEYRYNKHWNKAKQWCGEAMKSMLSEV
jgi:hypothetical protein